jgi:hypothetical protein
MRSRRCRLCGGPTTFANASRAGSRFSEERMVPFDLFSTPLPGGITEP